MAENEDRQIVDDTIAKSTDSTNVVKAVEGVFFTCDLLSDEIILPRKDIVQLLTTKLEEDLKKGEDRRLVATLMLFSLNHSEPRTNAVNVRSAYLWINCFCFPKKRLFQTLTKYIENIINSPDNLLFRRIKVANKVFNEKVAPVRGGREFLQAVGFVEIEEVRSKNQNSLPSF